MTQTQPDDPLTFTVDVGYTTSRPIVPDEHTSRVIVSAQTEHEAHLIAALMVMRPAYIVTEDPVTGVHPQVTQTQRAGQHREATVMPTRTTTVAVEI